MKRSVLLLAMAFFACAGASAQTADNASGQKINKKDLVVKEWNIGAKGGARQLDHVTVYSPEGKKIEETEYDTFGKQKWRKRFEWGDGDKVERELLYDERNRLVNYKKFKYNEFGKKQTQFTYDPKGKLISTKTFEYIVQDE